MREGISGAFKWALVMNILGTVMLGSSMFCNHPLLFMVIVMGGVGLLGCGFLIWLKLVLQEALGTTLFR
ncbi:MAG: hypothetical protein OEW11_11050 [Nitrospirota bacterium]|nr:hypothetical protein [Nitrospirota bacterium]